MVFGLRALHPPHPLRLQQQQQRHRLPASWHLPLPRAHHCLSRLQQQQQLYRPPASWHLPLPRAQHCLSCRPWRCRSLVRLLADIPRQAGLPPQSDRAYASSSSCGQHQSAEHIGRRRRRHCRCARPVPPNASLRLAAPTERLPGGRQRHPTTSLRGPRPSTDASAAPLPATSPACTSPCRAVAVGCDCHPWAGRTGHEGLRLQLRFLERGYTARQLGGCALRAARPLCAAQAVVAVGAVAETAG